MRAIEQKKDTPETMTTKTVTTMTTTKSVLGLDTHPLSIAVGLDVPQEPRGLLSPHLNTQGSDAWHSGRHRQAEHVLHTHLAA